MNEYQKLSKEPWTHVELVDENIQKWIAALIVLNPDSRYYGGYFKAKLTFPNDYPYSPPDFKFLRPLYHPNVYPDGRLCISILHPPSADERALEMAGELAAERWSPVQTVESVLLSVLSLLDDAEVSSPANVDAGVMLRQNPKQYAEMVKKVKTKKEDDYMMSWDDSDVEDDFGGSDSDMGEDFDDDDDGDNTSENGGDDDDDDDE